MQKLHSCTPSKIQFRFCKVKHFNSIYWELGYSKLLVELGPYVQFLALYRLVFKLMMKSVDFETRKYALDWALPHQRHYLGLYQYILKVLCKIFLLNILHRGGRSKIVLFQPRLFFFVINFIKTKSFYNQLDFSELASWSSGNALISGAGGLRFKSWTGQIGHSVANGSPPLQHLLERSCVTLAQ